MLLLKSVWVLTILFFFEFASADLENPINFGEPPFEATERSASVYRARDCGGASRVLEVRNDACIAGLESVCGVPSTKSSTIELYFIPRENLSDLEIRTTVVRQDGESKSYVNTLPYETMTVGREYVVKATFEATSELQKRLFTTRIEIYKKSDKRNQLCAEADFVAY